jgi:hypothetical protein
MYATCIGLILRGYDDYEQDRIRFISNNSDDSVDPVAEGELNGTFVTMAKTYEPSVEELLSQEFPGHIFSVDNSAEESVQTMEPADQTTTHVVAVNEQADLFSQPEADTSELKAINEVKNKNRGKLIKDIFGTVKGKIMYWFEDVDDQPLD